LSCSPAQAETRNFKEGRTVISLEGMLRQGWRKRAKGGNAASVAHEHPTENWQNSLTLRGKTQVGGTIFHGVSGFDRVGLNILDLTALGTSEEKRGCLNEWWLVKFDPWADASREIRSLEA